MEQVAPRDQTYKDDREGEKKYLDQLVRYWSAPTRVATRLAHRPAKGVKAEKAPPEVKLYFDVVSSGIHTFVGVGRLQPSSAGTSAIVAAAAQ